MSKKESLGLGACIWQMHSVPGYQHRLGKIGHYLGIVVLLSFVFIVVPMFLFTWIMSPFYFWLYRQKPIHPQPYFHFDRHKVQHLSFFDKLGCEYCELTNSTLQWMMAVTNAIEERWCPIKNQCDPNCSKVKEWRKDFLDYNHSQDERMAYYEKLFRLTLEKSKHV